ncbi:MAG: hypothetical protein QF619_11535, partial [Candidatus Binatia bacterium]|nr:hypothetical protein [Candidatus Binatia bacterium]
KIWEELGLPKLEPQQPWHGYYMGLWPEELEEEAKIAAEGRQDEIGKRLEATRIEVGEGETLRSMRENWGKTHTGRVD